MSSNGLTIVSPTGALSLGDYFIQTLKSSPSMSTPVAAVKTLTELVRGTDGLTLFVGHHALSQSIDVRE